MNITEARDVQILLRWILDSDLSELSARESAARLADRAYKQLSAGRTGGQVRQEWTRLHPTVIHDCPAEATDGRRPGPPLRVLAPGPRRAPARSRG